MASRGAREGFSTSNYDSRLLKNSSTGSFESAVLGTEYISPKQHGEIFGEVLRKYLTIPDQPAAGATVTFDIGLTINLCIELKGHVIQGSTGRLLPVPFIWPIMSDTISIVTSIDKSSIEVVTGSTMDHSGGTCWIDYTK